MSATTTAEHFDMCREIYDMLEHGQVKKAAQRIADSEAQAIASLKARIESDEELFHEIRMKVTAACGDPYKLHDEAIDSIIAERDQLRAEVERLTRALGVSFVQFERINNRAERAEAELKRYTDAVDAQPWATDEPIRILLDRITAEIAKERALLSATRAELDEVIKETSP